MVMVPQNFSLKKWFYKLLFYNTKFENGTFAFGRIPNVQKYILYFVNLMWILHYIVTLYVDGSLWERRNQLGSCSLS